MQVVGGGLANLGKRVVETSFHFHHFMQLRNTQGRGSGFRMSSESSEEQPAAQPAIIRQFVFESFVLLSCRRFVRVFITGTCEPRFVRAFGNIFDAGLNEWAGCLVFVC